MSRLDRDRCKGAAALALCFSGSRDHLEKMQHGLTLLHGVTLCWRNQVISESHHAAQLSNERPFTSGRWCLSRRMHQDSRMIVLVIQHPRLRPTSFFRIPNANAKSTPFWFTLTSTLRLPSSLSLISLME